MIEAGTYFKKEEHRAKYLENALKEGLITREDIEWAAARTDRPFYALCGPNHSVGVWSRDGTTDGNVTCDVVTNDDYGLKSLNLSTRPQKGPLTIIDIGAHIGSFTVAAKTLFPDANIYSFEALEENFEYLTKNVEKLSGVHIENCAVGGNRIASDFKMCGKHGHFNAGGTQIVWSDTGQPIIAQTNLPEIIQKYNIDQKDILKLDCEGSEYEILPLAHESGILDKVRYLVMEIHVAPKKGRHFHDLFRYLDGFDYLDSVRQEGHSPIIRAYNWTIESDDKVEIL